MKDMWRYSSAGRARNPSQNRLVASKQTSSTSSRIEEMNGSEVGDVAVTARDAFLVKGLIKFISWAWIPAKWQAISIIGEYCNKGETPVFQLSTCMRKALRCVRMR